MDLMSMKIGMLQQYEDHQHRKDTQTVAVRFTKDKTKRTTPGLIRHTKTITPCKI